METKLIVTDVTQMGGTRICIGAISENWETIRPVLPYPGIDESFLYLEGGEVIRPFSRITLGLLSQTIDPPHTEDWEFPPFVLDHRGELPVDYRINFLNKILDPSVEAIFGTELHEAKGRYFVLHGTGERSLGTIKLNALKNINIRNYDGNYSYNVSFQDGSGRHYWMNITDLSFRYYVKQLIREGHNHFPTISRMIEEKLVNCDIYLRIGLGRGWHPDNSQPQNRCYLFITGLYSFPDYLDGNCFADFKERIEEIENEEDVIPF